MCMIETQRPSARSATPLFAPFREGDALTIPVVGICVGVFVLAARWGSVRFLGLQPSLADRTISASMALLFSIGLTAVVAALQPRREPMPWWGALTASLAPIVATGAVLFTRGATSERLAAAAIIGVASLAASIGVAVRRR
jgi:hypothetical protein